MKALPFPRSYWVKPGRLLAGFFPGSKTPAQAGEKLAALVACGVTHVVNLMEPDERDHSGQLFAGYSSALEKIAAERGASVKITERSIPDLAVPAVEDMQQTLDIIDAAMREGCVYVHCWGGRGRTGTVIGCWLARHGMPAGDGVLQRLAELTAHHRAAFPVIPETNVQRDFVRIWNPGQ